MAGESPAFIAAEELLHLMLAHATDGGAPAADYKRCRDVVLKEPAAQAVLPRFVRTCRDPDAFWSFIKNKYSGTGSYERRRVYLREEFEPVLSALEASGLSPADAEISSGVERLDSAWVNDVWSKALERRDRDPEGAITAARSLLEAVIKHVLDDIPTPSGIDYSEWDLPRLYGLLAKQLNLAPSEHTEQQFKQILGGCHSVVQGLGSLRNKASDAHGPGRRSYRPAPRHAALAVNLAGAMALFLVDTSEDIRRHYDEMAAELAEEDANVGYEPDW